MLTGLWYTSRQMGQENWLSMPSAGAASEPEPLLGGCCCCCCWRSCVLAETKLRNIAIMEPQTLCKSSTTARCPREEAVVVLWLRLASASPVQQFEYVSDKHGAFSVYFSQKAPRYTETLLSRGWRRHAGEVNTGSRARWRVSPRCCGADLDTKRQSVKWRSAGNAGSARATRAPRGCQISARGLTPVDAREHRERLQQKPSTRWACRTLESYRLFPHSTQCLQKTAIPEATSGLDSNRTGPKVPINREEPWDAVCYDETRQKATNVHRKVW